MSESNVTFKIEVQENPLMILLVFDRRSEFAVIAWQDAIVLASTMERVIGDVTLEFTTAYPIVARWIVESESERIKISHSKGVVGIRVEWTDRLAFTSLEAFSLVARAIRQKAQDAHLEMDKAIHLRYTKGGLNIKELFNRKTGVSQKPPGR